MSYEEIKEILYTLIGAIDYTERIAHLPNCNDCGWGTGCMYAPRLGEQVRINCPHWKEKQK